MMCVINSTHSLHLFNKRGLSEETKLMIHIRSFSRPTIPYSASEIDSGSLIYDLEVAAVKVLCKVSGLIPKWDTTLYNK